MFTLDDKTQSQGFAWFVWHWGILRFGAPFSALLIGWLFIRKYGFQLETLVAPKSLVIGLFMFVVLAPLSGVVWGSLMWFFTTGESD